MSREVAGFAEHVVADPSRLCAVSNQMSTTVGPVPCTSSVAVWTPSPLESRYMYCAPAGEARTRSVRAETRAGAGASAQARTRNPDGCLLIGELIPRWVRISA